MVNIYDDTQYWYSEKMKPQEDEIQGLEDLAIFFILPQASGQLVTGLHACVSGD